MKNVILKQPRSSLLLDPGKSSEWEVVVAGPEATVVLPLWGNNSELKALVRLVSRGAGVRIIGLVIGRGDSQIRLHTLQSHEAPETTSDLLVKSVIGDQAQFFYDGFIRVSAGAQKTNAYQRNENLLLSVAARADSRPGLEILANDVRCTHGATVSSVNPEEIWYLETRGIEAATGKRLIVEGFLHSAVDRITDGDFKQKILSQLEKQVIPTEN